MDSAIWVGLGGKEEVDVNGEWGDWEEDLR